MPKRNSISEFSIKIKLDTKTASKNLKNLKDNLEKFTGQMKRAFANQGANVKKLREGVRSIGDATKAQGRFNNALKRGKSIAVALVKPFKSMTMLVAAGLGIYTLHKAITSIWNMFSSIVSNGSKVQQMILTLNSAISASDLGNSLSPKNLQKLQKQQRMFVENLSLKFGLNMGNALGNYAKFFAASSNYLGSKGSQGLFTALTKLGVVYGMSSEKMDRAMVAFTQMASKNQVMAEELKQQLGDVLPGSMEIFARAMTKMGKYGTVTVAKLYDMMAKGKVIASEVLPYVTEEMNRMAKGGIDAALNLISVKLQRLNTVVRDVFSLGALNQFEGTLGKIVDKLIIIFEGKGFQTKVGTWIDDILKTVLKIVDEFSKGFSDFEKGINDANSLEEAKKAYDSFFTKVLLNPMKKVWNKFLTWLGVEGMSEKLVEAGHSLGKILGDGIYEGITNAIKEALTYTPRKGYNPKLNMKNYQGLELEAQTPFPQPSKQGNTVIINGGVNATAHSNDPDKAKEDATEMAKELRNDILIMSALSTAAF